MNGQLFDLDAAIERMAWAGAEDSLPRGGMFNSDQLAVMRDERYQGYKQIATVMLAALLNPPSREGTGK